MYDQTLETLRGWTAGPAANVVAAQWSCRQVGLHIRWGGSAAWTLLREGPRKGEAIRVSLTGVFGQRPCEHGVEVGEIGSALRYSRCGRTEVVTDDHSAIRVLERWRAGE